MMPVARGWLRDRPSPHDVAYIPKAPHPDWKPGAIVSFLPPAWDQGPAGTCTGQGVGAGIYYRRRREGLPIIIPSRLQLYWNGRIPEGTTAYDSGAQIRDVIDGAARFGACSEEFWPYDLSKLTTEPSPQAYAAALSDMAISRRRLPDPSFAQADTVIDTMRAAIKAMDPIVFGMTVFPSFMTAQVAETGIVPMPGPDEQPIGGHCQLNVDNDDASRFFIIRGSYGPTWAKDGHCLIPYEYMGKQGLTADFWSIEAVGSSPQAQALPVAA